MSALWRLLAYNMSPTNMVLSAISPATPQCTEAGRYAGAKMLSNRSHRYSFRPRVKAWLVAQGLPAWTGWTCRSLGLIPISLAFVPQHLQPGDFGSGNNSSKRSTSGWADVCNPASRARLDRNYGCFIDRPPLPKRFLCCCSIVVNE